MGRVSTKIVKKGKKYQRSGRYKAKAPWRQVSRWSGRISNLPGRSSIYGFPRSTVTTLRYCETYSLTSTASSIAKQVFRMNSIYDPDFTNTGHQPYYFDQLSTLYDHYVVLGSKLTVQFFQVPSPIGNAQPSGPVTVGIICDPTGTTSSLLSTLEEANTGVSRTIAPQGNDQAWLKTTYSPEKDIGVDESDDTVGAATNNNPSQAWYATVYACETNGSTAVTVNAKVTMEFTVRLKRLTPVTGS